MLENVGEITAELYGRWQTEDYVPPPVIDVSNVFHFFFSLH